MMNKLLVMSIVACAFLIHNPAPSHGEGLVQKASKDAVKGAAKGVEQEVSTGNLATGAKEVAKAMTDGLANSVPIVTSQIANQANVNRKAIGNVAREVSSDAVGGAMSATLREVSGSLGKSGDGPL